jgi:hypothetical protein
MGRKRTRRRLPKVIVNQRQDQLLVLLNACLSILLEITARPSINDPDSRGTTIQSKGEDVRARPTTMEVQPTILEIDKPPIVHVDRDMANSHPITCGVRKNL